MKNKDGVYMSFLIILFFLTSCNSGKNDSNRLTISGKVSVEYGLPYRYINFDGDIWNTTWADDDILYVYGNDAMAIGGTSFKHDQIVFGKLIGDDPKNLKGEVVNLFTDYNINNWKAAGLISINGTLYMTVMKHGGYVDESGRSYQVKDASIIKSEDHGKSWHRSFQANRDNPMFPDKRFCSPWFIQYGKDYNNVDTDNLATDYIYAISTDGYYDTGNCWYLGRVLKSKIGDLDANDWEFYIGVNTISSGRKNNNWSRNISSAKPIINEPGKVCKTGIQYIKGIRKYIMIQWYYKPPYDHGNDPTAASTSYWYLWQSDTPWGPWEKSDNRHIWTSEGLYCPVICPKFISSDGKTATIFATGNWLQANHWQIRNDEDNPYTLWSVPVTFSFNDSVTNNIGTFQDGGVFSIKNAFCNKILDSENSNNKAIVKLSDANSSSSGRWIIKNTIEGDRYYKIINLQSGLCLQGDNFEITQGNYIGADNQQWFIQYIGDGKYWIFPKSNSDMLLGCMDVLNNNAIQIKLSNHKYENRDQQRWLLLE